MCKLPKSQHSSKGFNLLQFQQKDCQSSAATDGAALVAKILIQIFNGYSDIFVIFVVVSRITLASTNLQAVNKKQKWNYRKIK